MFFDGFHAFSFTLVHLLISFFFILFLLLRFPLLTFLIFRSVCANKLPRDFIQTFIYRPRRRLLPFVHSLSNHRFDSNIPFICLNSTPSPSLLISPESLSPFRCISSSNSTPLSARCCLFVLALSLHPCFAHRQLQALHFTPEPDPSQLSSTSSPF
ncbi:hypothetical protein H105_02986 [Trichophyton soudanense CBS 452.61]|uniref:Uncharacterized protein n=1 Tax=Trichophyton soudanense CBS 452.61 TaxID=1215331 RepID=A0A022XXW8_TRISD|nr:hypothetical protein H105_02986 [Trichophyton soudanense CBS 452.61]